MVHQALNVKADHETWQGELNIAGHHVSEIHKKSWNDSTRFRAWLECWECQGFQVRLLQSDRRVDCARDAQEKLATLSEQAHRTRSAHEEIRTGWKHCKREHLAKYCRSENRNDASITENWDTRKCFMLNKVGHIARECQQKDARQRGDPWDNAMLTFNLVKILQTHQKMQ